MIGIQPIGACAALRKALLRKHPDWLHSNEKAWRCWIEGSAKRLPNGSWQCLALVISIRCASDIILHRAFLQILSEVATRPTVMMCVPTEASMKILQAHALREGWSSLVTILLQDELDEFVARLPGEMAVAYFSCPAALDTSDILELRQALDAGTSLVSALTGLNLPDGAKFGSAEKLAEAGTLDCGRSLTPGEIAFESLLTSEAPSSCLQHGKPDSDPSQAGRRRDDLLVRGSHIELNRIDKRQLLAISLHPEGGEARLISLQPAVFAAPSSHLTIKIPPRFASERVQRMQVQVIDDNNAWQAEELDMSVPATHIEPWMLSAYLNRGGGGNPVARAFAVGAGCRLAYAEDEAEILTDIPVVWGVLRNSDRLIAQARAQGLHFYYIDHAYFDRGHGHSYRITLNRYEAGAIRRVKNDRLKKLNVEVKPWRKEGRSIIVCPPTDFFMAAHNCADWLERTLASLALETDRPIVIRQKPRPGETSVPLAKALEDAHALVTHSSNVAIESVCLGTPVFVSPTSAAAPVGHTDLGLIEAPRYPGREAWLSHLAYSQYTLEEIADGTAWNLLKYMEERPFA